MAEPVVVDQVVGRHGVVAAGATHRGRVREQDEDAFGLDTSMDVYVVSDGMGGLAAGATAARTVVDAVPGLLGDRCSPPVGDDPRLPDALREVVASVSRALHDESREWPDLAGMGATVVLAAVGARLTVAHLGDSRAYLWSSGRLTRLTDDHSVVGLLMRLGHIRPTSVADHPARGRLTRYVGMQGQAQADVVTVPFGRGDRVLLCTDGLWGVVAHGVLADSLAAGDSAADTCAALVRAALDAGAPDNVTAVVVDRQTGGEPTTAASRGAPP
jgi:protein phosphatase